VSRLYFFKAFGLLIRREPQVKALEARLGVRLFERLHKQLILTAAGQAYLPDRPDYRCDRVNEGSGPGDWLIAPEGSADCPEVASFREWLRARPAREPARKLPPPSFGRHHRKLRRP
jgi:hypothetical protein